MSPRGLSILLVVAAARISSAGSPWAGNRAILQRTQATVSRMSLDEKISMIYGRNSKQDFAQDPQNYYVGNIPAVPRLGLPPIKLEDGPQGVADGLQNVTQWPSQLTVSMTWSPEIMQGWGAAMGQEQRMKGTNVMLGPDVNLARVPWSGRVFETMGEDPYLASALVQPLIRGIQSNNISACIKHYIFNNHEVNRQSVSSNVPERVGRELYLPAFLAAVDAGVGSLMCAFNRVNNTFSCENENALQKMLKDDGGYRGWVVTDWGAQHNTIASAQNGLDQEMEWDQDANTTRYGTIGFQNPQFKEAIQNGTVPMSRLDNMVTRIIEPMYALGLVDDPTSATSHNTATKAVSDAHLELAADIASASITMLKNDGILPLKTYKSVAILGNMWWRAGKGSGGVNFLPSPPGMKMTDPCKLPKCNPATSYLSQMMINEGYNITSIGYDSAQSAGNISGFNKTRAFEQAQAADVVVVVVYQVTGEGMDRKNLSLDNWQNEMVETAVAANPNTIVVARCSGAFAMPWLSKVRAVLYQLMPGQGAGYAAGRAISGELNPAGKLTVSFPSSIDATWLGTPLNPTQYPGTVRKNTWQEVDYSEELLVGYRWYDKNNKTGTDKYSAVFPFGFGLSYTSFSYENLVLSTTEISFSVKNTGKVAGDEIAQMYVGFPESAALPPKQLKGFKRVSLNPGESTVVTLPIVTSEYSIWDVATHSWIPVHGKFTFSVGASSADIRLMGALSL